MKKYFLLWLLVSSLGFAYAQSPGDCVQGISTDPDNPVKSNPTDPVFHENTFDWRQNFFPTRDSYNCNMEEDGMENPFYNVDTPPVAAGAASDFQPSDGWELVKRDMGFLMLPGQISYGTAVSNGGTFLNPYILLYNRYRGVLRVFAALPFNQPGQEVVISLKLQNDIADSFTDHNSLNGLFSQSTAIASPLDQQTVVRTMVSPTAYPDICKLFFFADFHVAYDPCVCHFKSMLEVTFDWVESSTFGAVGKSVGVTQDLKDALSTGYDPSKLLTDFWAEEFTVAGNQNKFDSLKAGTYIHARAWELYEAHMKKEEDKGNFDVSGALYFLAMVAKVGVVIATKGAAAPILTVTTTTAKFGSIGTASIVAASATVASAKKFTLAKALKVAAPLFDFLSSQSKEDKPAQMFPMAIESEVALRGRIEKVVPLASKTIQIGVPGSLGAGSLPEEATFTQPAYPTYNEALGLFAVLKRPTLEFSQGYEYPDLYTCIHPDPQVGTWEYPIYRRRSRYIGDLQYVFNPAAGVNESKTSILAALELHTSATEAPAGTRWVDNNVYTTPYLPLHCLGELTVEHEIHPEGCDYPFIPTDTFYIKLLIL